ncbi:MAG: DNA-3-methyladenine glycosylase I [Bdellovibrionales bacterium]
MPTYCDIAPGHPVHAAYHDQEYGFPVTDESALFERMALEIMQAGLSWEIILKKRQAFMKAFDHFSVDKVAAYGEQDTARLLADPGIVRNRRKIAAIIENAQRIKALRNPPHSGLAEWIAANHPLTKEEWTKLFRKQFVFMGGEVVGEFLMSIGYLAGAHHKQCPIFATIERQRPPWKNAI